MTSPRRARRAGRVGRIRALLAAAGVLGLGAVGTLAAWTDQSTATTGSFTAGRIDIQLNGSDNVVLSNFKLTNMAPGDSTTAVITVSNNGTVPFTYTISGTATNNGAANDQLGNSMSVLVYPNAACTSTPLAGITKFTFSAVSRPQVAVGGTDQLCVKATLPTDANTALQGTSTTGTFTFVATTI